MANYPNTGATGRITRIIGPVVDIEFPPDGLPAMYNALHADLTLDGVTSTLHFGSRPSTWWTTLCVQFRLSPTDGWCVAPR